MFPSVLEFPAVEEIEFDRNLDPKIGTDEGWRFLNYIVVHFLSDLILSFIDHIVIIDGHSYMVKY